jgi:hypothetical protein
MVSSHGHAGLSRPYRLADVDALVDHVTTIGDELTGTKSG